MLSIVKSGFGEEGNRELICFLRARDFLKHVTVMKGLSNNLLIRLKRSPSSGDFRRVENVLIGLRLITQNFRGDGAEGETRQDTPQEAAGGKAR